MSAYPIVTVRASALPDFLDCAARAEAKHLLNKRCPTSGNALLGTALHKSTAVYDKSRLEGAGITIDEAAGAAVDAIHKPQEEVSLGEDDNTLDEMESIAIALHHRYCREIAPWQKYAHVEVYCERVEITDIGLALTGTTDRVALIEHLETPTDGTPARIGHGIRDLKSGKTAVSADGTVKTKGHGFQLGVYEILAEQALGIPITEPAQIIGLQTGKTERGQRVGVGESNRPRDTLIGDVDSPGVLELVADMIHAGRFPGNPRSILCHEKYCPIFQPCKFRR
jgi:hypothetical protein